VSFCSRCFQGECSRSLHGKSRFEVRALTWQDTLFNNVPRLDPKDPRFQEIASKRFLPVAPPQMGTSSAWMDPRDVEPSREISIPSSAVPVASAPPPPLVTAPTPSPQAVEMVLEPQAVQPAPTPSPAPPAAPAEPVIRNTPARPRQMIGGGDPKPASPVLDPWQPKQPLRPDEVLVKPGGRIKLGK
jgi:hypothetical protein